MRVGIATDHGGFGLKEELLAQLRAAGHEVVDFGAHADSHSLAATATIRPSGDRVALHLMTNAYREAPPSEVPPIGQPGGPWRRCVDTFRDSPEDIVDWADGPVVHGPTYHVQPRSIVVLVARTSGRDEAGRLPANADPAQPTRDGPGQ
jgi:hypothetical protein